jgi:hypothetical protein
MNRIITLSKSFILIFLIVSFFSIPALAANQAVLSSSRGVGASEYLRLNGEYIIFVLREEMWQEAGRLSFDKNLRDRCIDLGKYLSEEETVTIRLKQRGGGAAHIDAVLLGVNAPVDVRGINDPLALKKLSQKDYDVIDAFEKDIELVFSSQEDAGTLTLSARVEPEVISKTPFHFPLSNTYKPMTETSEFYTYTLIHNTSRIRANAADTSFFKEYSITGSGHPSGYTYGMVSNDKDNLYVNIDFTPDNTLDGEKDYAKVYVKTETDLKEFKLSVPDTTWGRPDFTYTKNVAYQHKVYNFIIPLKEIGIEAIAQEKEILLAFAAYGTATPLSTYLHEVLLNTSPSSGGDVEVQDKDGLITIPSINYRVRIEVDPMNEAVIGGSVMKWNAGISDFEVTAWLTGGYPIAIGQGINGTNAVEWGANLSELDDLTGSFTGYFHSTRVDGQPASDYTQAFTHTLADNRKIPTLSEWGVIFFVTSLMSTAIWFIRKRSKTNFLAAIMIVGMVVGIAWAATIVLDGDVGDWSAISPKVTDPFDDQSGDPNEDIRYGFVANDETHIYFRVDYTGMMEPD